MQCMSYMTLVMFPLGQADPGIAETSEIVVFPKRGLRFPRSNVPKPHVEIPSPDPPRNPWDCQGDASGASLGRLGEPLGAPLVHPRSISLLKAVNLLSFIRHWTNFCFGEGSRDDSGSIFGSIFAVFQGYIA